MAKRTKKSSERKSKIKVSKKIKKIKKDFRDSVSRGDGAQNKGEFSARETREIQIKIAKLESQATKARNESDKGKGKEAAAKLETVVAGVAKKIKEKRRR